MPSRRKRRVAGLFDEAEGFEGLQQAPYLLAGGVVEVAGDLLDGERERRCALPAAVDGRAGRSGESRSRCGELPVHG